MRDSNGHKRGELTVELAFERAGELIEAHGVCLFIMDVVHSSTRDVADRLKQYALLDGLLQRIEELFGDDLPENQLSRTDRIDKGFIRGMGDAAWGAIIDPEFVLRIVELKDREFPELELHYGVAADAWSEGIELIR